MDLEAVIKNAGFDLARQRKHKIYRDAFGRTLVTASTPSDRRFHQQVLAQLCRITGTRKHELLAPKKPKRSARKRGPEVSAPPAVEAWIAQTTEDPPVPVTPSPAPAPLMPTRSERKRLKRLEKYEAQRRAKRARQLERLREEVGTLHRALMENEPGHFGATHAAMVLYQCAKQRLGFGDTEIMVADLKLERDVLPLLIVRVSNWFLDFYWNEVRNTAKWSAELPGRSVVEVEVYGAVEIIRDAGGEIVGLGGF